MVIACRGRAGQLDIQVTAGLGKILNMTLVAPCLQSVLRIDGGETAMASVRRTLRSPTPPASATTSTLEIVMEQLFLSVKSGNGFVQELPGMPVTNRVAARSPTGSPASNNAHASRLRREGFAGCFHHHGEAVDDSASAGVPVDSHNFYHQY